MEQIHLDSYTERDENPGSLEGDAFKEARIIACTKGFALEAMGDVNRFYAFSVREELIRFIRDNLGGKDFRMVDEAKDGN
jgi:hypothetical protein